MYGHPSSAHSPIGRTTLQNNTPSRGKRRCETEGKAGLHNYIIPLTFFARFCLADLFPSIVSQLHGLASSRSARRSLLQSSSQAVGT